MKPLDLTKPLQTRRGEDSTRLMAQDATVYGAGTDVALTRRLLGGLAYTRADDAERIEARLGWRF